MQDLKFYFDEYGDMDMYKTIIITTPFIFLFFGCAIASDILHKAVNPKIHNYQESSNALNQCNFEKVISIININQNQLLKNSEMGLAYYFNHDYKLSNSYFDKAITEYKINEDKALIDISTLLRKEYQGEGYEKVLLHNYKAINYLLNGKLESALIEARNSNLVQKEERKKLSQFIKENSRDNINSHLITRYQKLFDNVDPKHNPYQNPFAYYISALSYAEDGDYNSALIDIKQAIKWMPDSELLKSKLKLYKSNTKNQKYIELFFDVGQSPLKSQVQLEINIDDENRRMAYMPSYSLEISDIDYIKILNSDGVEIGRTSILADINAIKINDFKEKLPSILYLISQEATISFALHNLDEKSKLLSSLFKSVSAIYSQNNISTWSLLPQKILVSSFLSEKDMQYKLVVVSQRGLVLAEHLFTISNSVKTNNIYKHFTLRGKKICQKNI